ncbi:hypothetical protein ADIS_4103 [Lunatimonas lonarensis]|uniref:Uncharacterized protein n=1 Tax=Lunatimonas lonarensis TaxID=1232681 RepID=R7ZN00_9BACT|nr:hypothetical protein ADIS_4103 [Lunatimonas lonarensis]
MNIGKNPGRTYRKADIRSNFPDLMSFDGMNGLGEGDTYT